MTVIHEKTPEPRKPRPQRLWTDWLMITLALASIWYGVCALVQLMLES
jgi:hypothetical protein